MQSMRTKRSLLSYGVLLTLAFQLVSMGLPMKARAAGPGLVINEINWGGSKTLATDEWVELYNPAPAGSPAIDFVATPYTFDIRDAADVDIQAVTINTGSLLPGNYLLLRGQVDPTLSTVKDVLPAGAAWYTGDKFTMLPNVASEYILKDMLGNEVDALKPATPGGTIPFVGSGTDPIASMERVYTAGVPGDGIAATSWQASVSHGANFRDGIVQFGTPGEANSSVVTVKAPKAIVVTPQGFSTLPVLPAITGTVESNVTTVRLYAHKEGVLPSAEVFFDAPVSGGTFTVSPSGLEAGRYTFQIDAADVLGNRSDRANVVVKTGDTEYNYMIYADVSSPVPAPVVTAMPAITNAATVSIQATTDATASIACVDVVRNGEFLESLPVTGNMVSGTAFLIPNQSNSFNFVAVAADNHHVSAPTPAMVVVSDTIAPLAVIASKVKVDANVPGTADMITGLASAAEPATKLSIYGDAALTQMIGSVLTVNADGSFAAVNIGDNKLAHVYLRLVDAAGNIGPVTTIDNPIAFANPTGNIGLALLSVTQTQAIFAWHLVPGAVNYKVKYKLADGTFTSAMILCPTNSATCAPTATLINLTAGTNYVIAVTSVDPYGNEGPYNEVQFQTAQPTPVVVTQVIDTPVAPVTTPAPATTPTKTVVEPSPTPVAATVTPTPTPSASPETGEVKSSTDTATKNVTPWIVLGVLVAIAAIATLGYFYWFGGVDEAEAMASVAAARATIEKKSTDTPPAKATDSKPAPKPNKDKRW